MKTTGRSVAIILLIIFGGLFVKVYSQMCCGAFAVSVIKSPDAIFLDSDSIHATCTMTSIHSGATMLAQAMEYRDGYFAIGMWPSAEILITIEIDQKQMRLRLRNPPGYDTRSFAIKDLQFREGDYQVDEARLKTWLKWNDKLENEGMFKGFRLIPIEFVKPLQKK